MFEVFNILWIVSPIFVYLLSVIIMDNLKIQKAKKLTGSDEAYGNDVFWKPWKNRYVANCYWHDRWGEITGADDVYIDFIRSKILERKGKRTYDKFEGKE